MSKEFPVIGFFESEYIITADAFIKAMFDEAFEHTSHITGSGQMSGKTLMSPPTDAHPLGSPEEQQYAFGLKGIVPNAEKDKIVIKANAAGWDKVFFTVAGNGGARFTIITLGKLIDKVSPQS